MSHRTGPDHGFKQMHPDRTVCRSGPVQVRIIGTGCAAYLQLCLIETSGLDLIDELLKANRTSPSLQEYHDKVKDGANLWTLEDCRLLKHQERLVVAEKENLCTRLIAE